MHAFSYIGTIFSSSLFILPVGFGGWKALITLLGVIVFMLLAGYFPFHARTDGDMVNLNCQGEYNMRKYRFQNLSQDVIGVLPVPRGGTGSSTSPMIGVVTAADAAAARAVLEIDKVDKGG